MHVLGCWVNFFFKLEEQGLHLRWRHLLSKSRHCLLKRLHNYPPNTKGVQEINLAAKPCLSAVFPPYITEAGGAGGGGGGVIKEGNKVRGKRILFYLAHVWNLWTT